MAWELEAKGSGNWIVSLRDNNFIKGWALTKIRKRRGVGNIYKCQKLRLLSAARCGDKELGWSICGMVWPHCLCFLILLGKSARSRWHFYLKGRIDGSLFPHWLLLWPYCVTEQKKKNGSPRGAGGGIIKKRFVPCKPQTRSQLSDQHSPGMVLFAYLLLLLISDSCPAVISHTRSAIIPVLTGKCHLHLIDVQLLLNAEVWFRNQFGLFV